MVQVCEGIKTKDEMLVQSIEQYKDMYVMAKREFDKVVEVNLPHLLFLLSSDLTLLQSVRRYIEGVGARNANNGQGNGGPGRGGGGAPRSRGRGPGNNRGDSDDGGGGGAPPAGGRSSGRGAASRAPRKPPPPSNANGKSCYRCWKVTELPQASTHNNRGPTALYAKQRLGPDLQTTLRQADYPNVTVGFPQVRSE